MLKRLISLRRLIILSTDEILKSSFTVFALKYFVRMWWKSVHEMRKCLTVKGSLHETQQGGCSIFSIWVSLVCPIRHLVIFVWSCLLRFKNEHLLLKFGFSAYNLFSVCFSQTDWHLFMTYWWKLDLKSEWIFKLVINDDKVDLASRSASSLPWMLIG